MNRRLYVFMLAVVVTVALGLGDCMARDGKKEENEEPVVIVLWHSYNAVAKDAFDDLAVEFNETVGMEQGTIVESVGHGSSNEPDDVLYASASHVIGSGSLPGIFPSYSGNMYRSDGIISLVHLDDYSTEGELDAYRSEFPKEGVWEGDGIHRMIPMAKSMGILYLNETDQETSAGEAGAGKKMLKTWEGLAQTAGMYYEWSRGSPFLDMNAFNDLVTLSATQLGKGIRWTRDGPEFDYSRDMARKVWDAYYVPHIRGWYESRTYNQDGVKSGRLMAYIGSSAGAGFFPQLVIKDEKQSHPISCQSHVYPVFQDGMPYMGQRGANMAVFAPDESRQRAAARFLKWFTQPEQSIRFIVVIGYLSMQEEALESISDLASHVESQDSVQTVEQNIRTSLNILKDHNVYVRKTFLGFYDMDRIFSSSLKNCVNVDLETLKRRTERGESRESVERELLDEEYFSRWYETLLRKMADKADEQKIQK